MARLPKPPGERVRRSGQQASWRTLPPAKPFKAPALPERQPAWLKSTRTWWKVLWSSPMSVTFLEADVPALTRLAEMIELRARGELGPTETVSMLAIEDRFGLNPKSRRALQWEVSQAEREENTKPESIPKLRRIK